jgi:hypothetical protein
MRCEAHDVACASQELLRRCVIGELIAKDGTSYWTGEDLSERRDFRVRRGSPRDISLSSLLSSSAGGSTFPPIAK